MKVRSLYKDIFFHIIFIIAIIILVGLPIRIKSTTSRSSDYFYTRPHGLLADYYYYLAIIQEGRNQLYETDPYTTEIASPSQIHIYYVILGRLAEWFRISNIDMYYIGLFIPLVLYYSYTYLLVSIFFKNCWKWLTMFLIFFTGPFPPWTIHLFGQNIYFGTSWWTKMDPMARLTQVPHHFFPSALLVGAVYYFLRYYRSHLLRFGVICGFFLMIGELIYGIPSFVFLISMIGVLFLQWIVARSEFIEHFQNRIGYMLIGISILIPLGILYYQLTSIGLPWSKNLYWEYSKFKNEEFPILLSIYLLNLGIILPFSLSSYFIILRNYIFENYFIFAITFVPIILWELVAHGIFQICKIRLVYTSPYVFWGILATLGIITFYKSINRKIWRNIFFYSICLLFVVNSIITLYTYWKPALQPDPYFGNIYLHKSYMQAISYINEHNSGEVSIFTDFYSGMYIPSFSHTKVFIGHEVSTLDYPEKLALTDTFFSGKMDQTIAVEIFRQHQIRYVYWDTCYYPKAPVSYNTIIQEVFHGDCVSLYTVL